MTRLTMGSTGAALGEFLVVFQCYVRGPVIPTVMRILRDAFVILC
jgi:hypothetical protein